MSTNRKEIELDENDRDLIADEAERLGKHWKQVLKEKLSIVQHPVHADADGQVAPKTTLVAALDTLRQRHEAAGGTFRTLEEVLQDTYERRGRWAK